MESVSDRGSFCVIDDDDLEFFLCGLKFESKLFLQGGEEGWFAGRARVGRPRDLEEVFTAQFGAVEDLPIGVAGEGLGEFGSGAAR